MGSKLSLLTAFMLCIFGGCLAQSVQIDPAELTGNERSGNEAKVESAPPVSSGDQQQFSEAIKDVHFDFDKADLRPEDQQILTSNAEWLKAHAEVMIVLEGNADERGTIIYNLVLSGERANIVKDALVEIGIPEDRIAFATGWGKLYPVCSESDENCWSQNRRTHFETWPPLQAEGTSVAASVTP